MIQTSESVLRRQPWYRNLDYEQQIHSEEWKSFGREIRRQHENACEICKRSDIATEVHHFNYAPGKKLWEYDNADVALLCTPCHRAMHAELSAFRKKVFKQMTPRLLQLLNEAIQLGFFNSDKLEFMHAMKELAVSPRSVTLFANAWQKREAKPEDQKNEK